MDGVAGLEGWRWLFIIEGVVSVFIAILVFCLLPDSYENARFLSEDDRKLCRLRTEINIKYHGNQQFEWAEVKKALKDPKLYVSGSSQFWADICSFSFSTFLPLILRSFGFGTVTTQLLTIPVYFWASSTYIVVSIFSDRWRRRAFFMIPAACVTAIGYAINIGAPMSMRGVLYFSVFLIAPGIYIIVGLNATWLLNSHAGYYKRATAIGMNQSIGNSAGVVVGQIFKATVNGKYLLGLSFCLGSILLASIGHATLYWHFKRENKKRENLTPQQREHEIQYGKGGDFHPDYRYAL